MAMLVYHGVCSIWIQYYIIFGAVNIGFPELFNYFVFHLGTTVSNQDPQGKAAGIAPFLEVVQSKSSIKMASNPFAIHLPFTVHRALPKCSPVELPIRPHPHWRTRSLSFFRHIQLMGSPAAESLNLIISPLCRPCWRGKIQGCLQDPKIRSQVWMMFDDVQFIQWIIIWKLRIQFFIRGSKFRCQISRFWDNSGVNQHGPSSLGALSVRLLGGSGLRVGTVPEALMLVVGRLHLGEFRGMIWAKYGWNNHCNLCLHCSMETIESISIQKRSTWKQYVIVWYCMCVCTAWWCSNQYQKINYE